jgi:predicted DNA-binding protein
LFYSDGQMKTTAPSNIRLPDEMKARIRGIAVRNSISVSDVVRMALVAQVPVMEAGAFRLNSNGSGVQGAGGVR